MKNSILFSIFFLLLIIVSFIIATVIVSDDTTQLSASELNKCNTLIYNDENAIDLVFFSSKETAEKYSNFLLNFQPLNENKEVFNIHYIDDYQPECETYKGIAILCHNKELIKKASSCPNDYIIVIKPQPNNIRSSSYTNVMSINENHPLTVLAHEFGHAFVPLAEEYTPAQIPSGSENCKETCSEFPEEPEINGCFQGCSDSEFHRSIENGIMRTLSSNSFGIFNENLLKNQISLQAPELLNSQASITGQQVKDKNADCSLQKYYLINGFYDSESNEMSLIDKTIENGCPGKNGAGGFNYMLILEDNSTLPKGQFNPELIFTDSPSEKNNPNQNIKGQTFNSEKSFYLKIPEIKESKTIEISKGNKLLLEINLLDVDSRFCKI